MSTKTRKPFLLAAMMALATAAPSLAQSQVGTRAAGMAGAFVAVADDATAVYWNPAGVATGSLVSAVVDFGQAEKAAIAWITARRAEQRASMQGPAPTVRTAVETHDGHLDARERTEQRERGDTRRRLARHVLSDPIADMALHRLSEGDLIQWRERRPPELAPTTVGSLAACHVVAPSTVTAP